MKIKFLIVLIFSIQYIVAQNVADTTNNELYFEPDREAKEAVAKILQYTGLEPNFYIVEADVPTVIAYIKNGQRYIGYNPEFIRKVRTAARTDWAAVSVLAHDIGHHLSGHTIKPKGTNPGDELAADKFSGFILYQMGANLEEAKAALVSVANDIDTINHPAIKVRIQAVSNGWLQAKILDEKGDPEKFFLSAEKSKKLIFKCKFKGDPNVYFIDEHDDIVWFDNYGSPIIIGKKEASDTRNYAWIYHYREFKFGVDSRGNIWDMNSSENIFITGEVISLEK